jgi:hypothetical protein
LLSFIPYGLERECNNAVLSSVSPWPDFSASSFRFLLREKRLEEKRTVEEADEHEKKRRKLLGNSTKTR